MYVGEWVRQMIICTSKLQICICGLRAVSGICIIAAQNVCILSWDGETVKDTAIFAELILHQQILMVGCGKLHEPVICIVPNQTPSGIEKTWCIKSSTSITRHNVNSCIICPSEVFCLCTHTIVLHPEEEKKNETKPSQFLCIRSEPRIEAHGPKFTDGCKFTRTQVHKNPSSQMDPCSYEPSTWQVQEGGKYKKRTTHQGWFWIVVLSIEAFGGIVSYLVDWASTLIGMHMAIESEIHFVKLP